MILLKTAEFQGGSGRWYVSAAHQQPNWNWKYIPNMLKLDAVSYVKLLQKYGATDIIYNVDADVLLYSFESKEKAHKWVLYINRIARNTNYMW